MPDPIPATQPAPNITLTSNEPVATTVRSGLQLLTGGFLVEGLELFLIDLTEDQAKWAAGALTIALVFAQNWLEKRRGRKYLGAAPTAAVRDDGHTNWQTALLAAAVAIVVFFIFALVFDIPLNTG